MYYVVRYKDEFITDASGELMRYCKFLNSDVDEIFNSAEDDIMSGYKTKVDPIKCRTSNSEFENQVCNIYAVTDDDTLIDIFKSSRRHKYFYIETYKKKPDFIRIINEVEYTLKFMTYDGVKILSNESEYGVFHGIIDYYITDAVMYALAKYPDVPVTIFQDDVLDALDAIHYTNIAGFSEYGFGVPGMMDASDAEEYISNNIGYGMSPMGTYYSVLMPNSLQLYMRVLGFSIKKGI